MSARKYRTQTEWEALINQQEQSGLSVLAFCRQHKLYAKTFYRQRKVLGRRPTKGRSTASASPFIQVATAQAVDARSSGMSLHYRTSQLHLPEGTDPLWIAKLLQALS